LHDQAGIFQKKQTFSALFAANNFLQHNRKVIGDFVNVFILSNTTELNVGWKISCSKTSLFLCWFQYSGVLTGVQDNYSMQGSHVCVLAEKQS